MTASEDVSQVSMKEAMGGGMARAICNMRSSGIGPGPLGIRATRPRADAPASMAIPASSSDEMQQILTLGIMGIPLHDDSD
jgi:hypothetical protein